MKKAVKGIVSAIDDILPPPSSPSSSGSITTFASSGSTTTTTTSASAVSTIATSNIFDVLSDMDSSEVINSLGGPKSGNLEEKLDFLISLFVQQKKENDQHKEMIKNLISKTATLEKENAALKREVRAAKESINRSELASRNLTLRVLGLPISSEESRAPPGESNKVAVKAAYDKILKPIWTAAKNKGAMPSLPQFNTAVEFGYRVRSNAKDNRGNPYPPPLLIHLTSKLYRTEIFKNKREAMPAILEQEGLGNIFIVEELTASTIKRMKELREDDRVERVWSVEGSIRFCLKDDPSKPRTCYSVYGPISEIIK